MAIVSRKAGIHSVISATGLATEAQAESVHHRREEDRGALWCYDQTPLSLCLRAFGVGIF